MLYIENLKNPVTKAQKEKTKAKSYLEKVPSQDRKEGVELRGN